MPIRQLPSSPSLDHLKNQARDVIRDRPQQSPDLMQRLREFHPRFAKSDDQEIATAEFTLSDAQLFVAREYGFASWPKLHAFVARKLNPDAPLIDRIEDPVFRHAVECIDDGDAEGLGRMLETHPNLANRRVEFEGRGYFKNPSVMAFIAENPVRNDSLPPNIVDIARLLIESGADEKNKNGTLMLVCSGRVPREQGFQIALIDLFCDHGADPNRSMPSALGHGEMAAVEALIRRGAAINLPAAVALGRLSEAQQLLLAASAGDRHLAMTYAAMYGRSEIMKMLLNAGEDPNRYNPMGTHSHSTPLHQAAWGEHLDTVQVLVEAGARLDLKDTLWSGTPLDWAEHGNLTKIAEYLTAAARLKST